MENVSLFCTWILNGQLNKGGSQSLSEIFMCKSKCTVLAASWQDSWKPRSYFRENLLRVSVSQVIMVSLPMFMRC